MLNKKPYSILIVVSGSQVLSSPLSANDSQYIDWTDNFIILTTRKEGENNLQFQSRSC